MGWGRAVARAGCPRCRAWDAWPGRDWTEECNYSADVWERSPPGFYPGRRWNTASVKAKKIREQQNTRGTPDQTLPSRLAVPSTWIQRQQVRPPKAFLVTEAVSTVSFHHATQNINECYQYIRDGTGDCFNKPCKRFQNGTNRAVFHSHNHSIRCNQRYGNN